MNICPFDLYISMNVELGLSDAFSRSLDGILVVRRSNFVGIGSGSFYRKIISPIFFLTERLFTEKLVDRTPFDRTPFER
jgi:hypothetical protein